MSSVSTWKRWATILVSVSVGCSDETEEQPCASYACVNAAALSGPVLLSDSVLRVDAKYCRVGGECVEGAIELEKLAVARQLCTATEIASYVCLSRDPQGEWEVNARFALGDGKPRPDGDEYTLTVVDADSGDVLVDVTRVADYEVTRQDNCHLCWGAEMSL